MSGRLARVARRAGGSIVRLSVVRLGVLLVPSCLLAAGAASAQAPATPARAAESTKLRSQISIMEGILEKAVGEGIRGAVNQMPELFQGPGLWVAPPRARGFRIEGYGVFFDVEVPGLPATTWSISILTRSNEIALVNELNQLRALVLQSVPEPAKRVELTKGFDKVQSRVSSAALSEPGVAPAPAPGAAALVSQGAQPAPARAPAPPIAPLRDPNAIYTDEVQKALTTVMLEQGITMQVAPEEWFTIAASESRGGWGEPESMTLYLSIRGRDLAALRTRQITPEEAAKRIIAKNY